MTITVDEIPPSYNQYLGNSRSHFAYHTEKKRWLMLIKQAIGRNPKRFEGKVAITISYTFPDRKRRDLDNYSGKFVMDALVHWGIIKDDSYKVIAKLTLQAESGANPRTTIKIKEVK